MRSDFMDRAAPVSPSVISAPSSNRGPGHVGQGLRCHGWLHRRLCRTHHLCAEYAPDFIFTTALPPVLVAGGLAAIRHLKTSETERGQHQKRVTQVKQRLVASGLPVMPSQSHIVPVLVGDVVKCEAASDALLCRHGIYVRPINFPMVPRAASGSA